MSVQAVNSLTTPQTNNKFKHNIVKYTGYGALGFGIASIVAAKNHKIKSHKYLAYALTAFAVTHTAMVEWFNHKKSNN